MAAAHQLVDTRLFGELAPKLFAHGLDVFSTELARTAVVMFRLPLEEEFFTGAIVGMAHLNA